MNTCSVEGCPKEVAAKDMCRNHYKLAWAQARRAQRPSRHRSTLRERLDLYTEKSDGCWLWIGCLNEAGYGMINVDAKARRAHRVIYEMERGPIPDGMLLMHACDTPNCVNPQHMRVGTNADNMRDMGDKRRSLFHKRKFEGESHGMAKLTAADVTSIRSRYAAGESAPSIAASFGIAPTTAWGVATGATWRHVPMPT